MSNPTTPFSWQMPTNTDLVTDLPADFAVFGQAVATSMADLLGGTTGQILSKTTNADMDFTWIANDQGDITAVTTTAPLQGGGSSGALALTVDAASTSASGVVQLSNSTSTTSSVLAATPTAVKSAYDLADGAIAKTTVTTAGDIIYRNATVPTRLGIGTAGQVLTVNSGATAPQWSTAAGGGKVLQVVQATYATEVTNNTTTFADTGLSVSITPSSATSKVLIMGYINFEKSVGSSDNAAYFKLVRASTDILQSYILGYMNSAVRLILPFATHYLDSPATTSATAYKFQIANFTNNAKVTANTGNSTSVIIAMEIGA